MKVTKAAALTDILINVFTALCQEYGLPIDKGLNLKLNGLSNEQLEAIGKALFNTGK